MGYGLDAKDESLELLDSSGDSSGDSPEPEECVKEVSCDEWTKVILEIKDLRETVNILVNKTEQNDEFLDEIKETMDRNRTYASCQEFYDNGFMTDGIYSIQPSYYVDSFNVDCSFEDGIATTTLEHTHSNPTGYTSLPLASDGCDEPGCFQDNITYSASIEQIEALIDISDTCEQYIQNNCSNNALTGFSYWTDRNGFEQEYWNGNKSTGERGCACNETGSCDDYYHKNNICNCDDRDNNIDEGILTSKEQLPVMRLSYGDSMRRYSWIHYTLGHFSCSGKKGLYPHEKEQVDCNFKVAMTNNHYALKSSQDLYFENTIYDYTDGSIDANGWFTAPVDGNYRFDIKLSVERYNTYHAYSAMIDVLLDDIRVDRLGMPLSDYGSSSYVTQSSVLELIMKKGQQLKLYTNYSPASKYSADGCKTFEKEHSCSYMTGRLLREL